MSKKNSNVLAIAIMFFLFAMISFVTGLQNPMGVIVKSQFGATNAMSQLGNLANFIAYAFMGLPAGFILKKYGYKVTALAAVAVGFIGVGISFLSIGLLSLLITAAAIAFQDPIISILQVPDDVKKDMADYLSIIFIGLPALFIYNFYASAERSVGNSRSPLLFMALSALLNVALDLVFVISFGWGVWGAAAATVISQYAAALGIALLAIIRHPTLRFSIRDMRIEKPLLSELLSLSVLTSLQQSIMNLGILCVQGIVNGFGSGTMAAFAAGVKIDSLAYMPLQEFGNAFSTFVSQNGGAGRKDRIMAGMKMAFLLVSGFALVISAVIFLTPGPLMSIFIDPGETELINEGITYLRIEGSFYILIGYLFLFYGIFRALKAPMLSLVLTIISLGLRVLLAAILSATPLKATGIWLSIPIGWAIADAAGLLFLLTKRSKR